MYRRRKLYFKNIWNWLILALIITSITSVVLHIIREKAMEDTIKELQRNIYAMVGFHKPLRLMHFETASLSIVIFLATVKLLRLLRFSKQTVFLSITVRFAGKYLFSFSFVFIVIFCSFAMSGMIAFGSVVESYSSFPRACVAQFEFLLGKAVPTFQMAKVNPFLSFLFSILYICSMTLFFLNLIIVILNCALEEVKDNLDSVVDELDLAEFMISYLFRGISNLFGWKNPRNFTAKERPLKTGAPMLRNVLQRSIIDCSYCQRTPFQQNFCRKFEWCIHLLAKHSLSWLTVNQVLTAKHRLLTKMGGKKKLLTIPKEKL